MKVFGAKTEREREEQKRSWTKASLGLAGTVVVESKGVDAVEA